MVESVYAKVLEASSAEAVIPWHVDEPHYQIIEFVTTTFVLLLQKVLDCCIVQIQFKSRKRHCDHHRNLSALYQLGVYNL